MVGPTSGQSILKPPWVTNSSWAMLTGQSSPDGIGWNQPGPELLSARAGACPQAHCPTSGCNQGQQAAP